MFAGEPRKEKVKLAPDLVVEIISDSEQPQLTEQRLRDYLEAGCEVWQVFAAVSTITVWRGNDGVRLGVGEVLTSDRLPGLAIPVSEVFQS